MDCVRPWRWLVCRFPKSVLRVTHCLGLCIHLGRCCGTSATAIRRWRGLVVDYGSEAEKTPQTTVDGQAAAKSPWCGIARRRVKDIEAAYRSAILQYSCLRFTLVLCSKGSSDNVSMHQVFLGLINVCSLRLETLQPYIIFTARLLLSCYRPTSKNP